jgi:AcrR family transcriptional regulator
MFQCVTASLRSCFRVEQTIKNRRGRPKAVPDEHQSACIVEQAKQLFLARGYGGTTTEDIATACHISKQTLYRLFCGKSALFIAVIEAHRQDMLDIRQEYHDLPLAAALEKIFRTDISPEADRERMALIQQVITEAPHFPELVTIAEQYGRDKSCAELSAWLRYRRARGEIVPDDTDGMASMLIDMVFGSIFAAIGRNLEWPGHTERRDYVRRCIDVFLNGVRPR